MKLLDQCKNRIQKINRPDKNETQKKILVSFFITRIIEVRF